MKKCYICTVLYCSIDVLGCDCCKKLCGKVNSVEKSVQEEKNEWLKKKTEWEYLKKYDTLEKRAKALKVALSIQLYEDNDVVPVVFEQHDKKKGCVFDEIVDEKMFAILKNEYVHTIYDVFFKGAKIKSLVFYLNGDPKLAYDGTDTPFGKRLISDENFLFDKNSEDPILKRTVFISYYAEKQNTES